MPKRGRPGRKLDSYVDALAAHIKAHPDATLAELAAWSVAERGVIVCVATMHAILQALGLTLKKVAPRRRAGARRRRRSERNLERVFIDETWATTNMTRTRGRAVRRFNRRSPAGLETGRRPATGRRALHLGHPDTDQP